MIKWLFFICIIGFVPFQICAQASDAPILVKQGKDLIAAKNEEAALEKFKSALKSDPNNYEAVWNASYLCSKIGNRQKDEEKKKEYFSLAKQYALKALKLKPTDAESNYVMAVAMGRMALIADNKDKVSACRDIKNYADLALKYNPNHAGAWDVLGKWNFEVANLNFVEVAFANTFFGGIPDGATHGAAIRCFNKAISLDPNYILYYLDLAWVYQEDDNEAKAMEILKKAVALSPRTQDDPSYIKKCHELLNSLK